MIRFERKKIYNKPFYYLTEQVRIKEKFKKIQVFVGKNIPKDVEELYSTLKEKEKELLEENLLFIQKKDNDVESDTIKKIESTRIDWKYHVAQMSDSKREKVFRDFAIRFIFESNAIEGSKLSQDAVSAIIKKEYIKKTVPEKEVQEVLNAIEAFNHIQSDTFTLNQKNIKILHSIITKDLDITQGFKKRSIVVNNKETVDPKDVREKLTSLIFWYNETKKTKNQFVRAIIFHNRFEHIHPFEDGNGRTGRVLLNWMLMQNNYGVILYKNSNRVAYRNSLSKGDDGQYRNILALSVKMYKNTIKEIING